MRNKIFFIVFLSFLIFSVYHNAFSNFFAQDDFVLLQKFSGNNFFIDLLKSLTSYHETHWRPLHNLFFLVSGNIFGKNYFLYHFSLFLIHTLTSYLIYLVGLRTLKHHRAAMVSSVVYAIHPFSFISLFWISGGATELAFLFFLISFIFWINNKLKYFLLFFIVSLLASESMIIGILIIGLWEMVGKGTGARVKDLKISFLTAALFGVFRFIFLTPKDVYSVYGAEISTASIFALKYYLLRVLGFAESNGDLLISLTLIFWSVMIVYLLSKSIKKYFDYKRLFFFVGVFIAGLLPFIAIPHHLSPHYINISVWAFASFVGVALLEKKKLQYILVFVFLIICFFNTKQTQNNNWVTVRSELSKKYISQIEKEDFPPGSTLVFNDNPTSSSLEAYYALGGGEAINFWFKDRNYKYCFTEFESCSALP